MIPALAYLWMPGDAQPRQTCLGCSKLLAELGLIRIVYELALPSNADYSVVAYELEDGVDLAQCRAAIRKRHVGPEWGS